MDVLEKALSLAQQGYAVFPLANNTKIPPKGHHGYLEASNDPQQVSEWFNSNPNWNIGLNLSASGLVVVDVDLHVKGRNGMNSIKSLANVGRIIPSDTYIEKTPHSGLHYFFKVAKGSVLSNKIDAWPGVDLITNFTVIAPSEIDGVPYTSIAGDGLVDAVSLPYWLVNKLSPHKHSFIATQRVKNRTGKVLDEIVAGAGDGHRHGWLASIVGYMIATGASPESVYQLARAINDEFASPPLETRDVNNMMTAILRKEARQFAR